MGEGRSDGWGTRLFLVLTALLLFGGLAYLGVGLFRQLAHSTPPAPTDSFRRPRSSRPKDGKVAVARAARGVFQRVK